MHAPEDLTLVDRLGLTENDDDNARRLMCAHGADLIYVQGKQWAVWDGGRYSFQGGAEAAFEVGNKLRWLVAEEADFAAGDWVPTDDAAFRYAEAHPRKAPSLDAARECIKAETAERLRKHAIKCGNVSKIDAAMKSLAHRRRAVVEDLDADPFQFVVTNGQLDLLRAMQWERPDGATDEEIAVERAAWLMPEVDREALPTRRAGIAYDPDADCPTWEGFVETIVPDADIRGSLQRALGAMLFGENRAQVCLILRGPGGNGKSTLLNALQAVLGTRDGYAATCQIDMFLEHQGASNAGGATPEEVDLPGARAYIATEPGARDVLSAKKIKGLTGGDRRMSRGLYQGAFFWTPHGLPIISCNRMPKVKDEDEGTRRRLVILPLEVNLRALPPEKQIPPGKIDRKLAREAPGILNWLIEGFRAFMDIGIAPAERMETIKASLMESADPVGVFLAEMTVPAPKSRINVSEFYKAYEKWCEEEGRTLYQMQTVGNVMVEKGHERGKYAGVSTWKGLAWAETARPHVTAAGYDFPIAAPADGGADAPAF